MATAMVIIATLAPESPDVKILNKIQRKRQQQKENVREKREAVHPSSCWSNVHCKEQQPARSETPIPSRNSITHTTGNEYKHPLHRTATLHRANPFIEQHFLHKATPAL